VGLFLNRLPNMRPVTRLRSNIWFIGQILLEMDKFSASDAVRLRVDLLYTNVRLIQTAGKVDQLEKRIIKLENFKKVTLSR
jgi:hypothetical protein